jgi:hypothetical protein
MGGGKGDNFFLDFYYDNTDMAQHDLIKGLNVFFSKLCTSYFFSQLSFIRAETARLDEGKIRCSIFMMYK